MRVPYCTYSYRDVMECRCANIPTTLLCIERIILLSLVEYSCQTSEQFDGVPKFRGVHDTRIASGHFRALIWSFHTSSRNREAISSSLYQVF
jgi:hypothetical protein